MLWSSISDVDVLATYGSFLGKSQQVYKIVVSVFALPSHLSDAAMVPGAIIPMLVLMRFGRGLLNSGAESRRASIFLPAALVSYLLCSKYLKPKLS